MTQYNCIDSSIHRLCGYANALIFKKVNDDDIDKVQAFIRDEVMTFIQKSTADAMNESDKSCFVQDDDVLFYDDQLIDYFGKLYAPQPAHFRFQPGDRMLIKELVSHVAGKVDSKGTNSGLRQFKTNKPKPITQKNIKRKKTTGVHSLDNVNLENIKSDLIQRVIKCMQLHRANVMFDLDLENEIHENIVNVTIENGFVHGTVQCIICNKEKKSKNKPKKIHYSSGSEWPCWVLSNFGNHLKTVHHLTIIELETKLNEIEVEDENKNDHSQPGLDDSVMCLGENIQIADNSTQNTELNTNIYTQLSNQITLMMSTVLKNSELQEEMHFKLNDDVQQSLSVAIVAGDGNCLYSALTHQLENKRINSKGHQSATTKLRDDVVKYILDNYSKFSHQLRDRVYDLKESENIDNIDTECKLFVRLVLSRNGTWGGAETIHAVSELKQVNIVLFNEDGPCYMLTNMNANYDRTICIAYRQARNECGEVIKSLRNHYDSVCDVSSTVLFDAAQIIAKNQK